MQIEAQWFGAKLYRGCIELVVMGMTIEGIEPFDDPGHGNAERHFLHNVLIIALCIILCGGLSATSCEVFAGRIQL